MADNMGSVEMSRALGKYPLPVWCLSLSISWLIAPSRTVAAMVVSWTTRSLCTRPRPLPLSFRTHTLPVMAHARRASLLPSLQVVSLAFGLMSAFEDLTLEEF